MAITQTAKQNEWLYTCCTGMNRNIAVLLLISALIRTFLAAILELGNDEVYYYTYALYPDWSHFDHPPMVGWVMQLFSFNLYFDSSLFLRLSSIVLTTLNTIIIYQIGKSIRNEATGFYAALLYTSSIYAFVITGIMILPDTPQNVFWMLALWLMIKIVSPNTLLQRQNTLLIMLGLIIGLGIISKYTSVFLWFGFGLYVLLYKRSLLKRPALYASVAVSVLCTIPVIDWNIKNDFISFAFQGERVNIFSSSFRADYFFGELFGQIVYNNPVNVLLIVMALFGIIKGKLWVPADQQRLLLLVALPMIGIFLLFSMFRATLPHWTGPAYNTLIILGAARLAELFPMQNARIKIPNSIKASLALLTTLLVLAVAQINFGFIQFPNNNSYHQLGKNDVTLDMFGWKQLKSKFEPIRDRYIQLGEMKTTDAIVGENWFPLANLDYYVARPLKMNALGLGKMERLHKYMWINEQRNGFKPGDDFWFLTTSRDYTNPNEVYQHLFSEIITADTITLVRSGKPAKRVFVFLLKDLKTVPEQHTKRYSSE